MLAVLLATAVAGFGVAYALGSSGQSADAGGTRTTGSGAALPTLDAPAGGPTIAAVGDAATLPTLRHRPRRRQPATPTTSTTPTTTTTLPPPTTTVQPPPRTTHTNPPPRPPTITEE
jgi:hypothetical protein